MLIAFHFPQNILWPFWTLIPPRNFLLSLLLPGLLNLSAAFFVCCSLPPSLVGEGETDSVCLYTGQRLPPGRLLQSGGGGVGSKTKVILCASPSEDQQTGQNAKAQYSKNKVYVGFLIPACCTRNAGRPSPLWLLLPWKWRVAGRKVSVLSYQNSSAIFFLEQGPTNCKILE